MTGGAIDAVRISVKAGLRRTLDFDRWSKTHVRETYRHKRYTLPVKRGARLLERHSLSVAHSSAERRRVES